MKILSGPWHLIVDKRQGTVDLSPVLSDLFLSSLSLRGLKPLRGNPWSSGPSAPDFPPSTLISSQSGTDCSQIPQVGGSPTSLPGQSPLWDHTKASSCGLGIQAGTPFAWSCPGSLSLSHSLGEGEIYIYPFSCLLKPLS